MVPDLVHELVCLRWVGEVSRLARGCHVEEEHGLGRDRCRAAVENQAQHRRAGAVVAEEEEGGVVRRHGPAFPADYDAAVRVSLADPVSYTIPYDRSLAEALARRGHEVDLLCASFMLADLPPPNGYQRHEVFFTRSARFLRGRAAVACPAGAQRRRIRAQRPPSATEAAGARARCAACPVAGDSALRPALAGRGRTRAAVDLHGARRAAAANGGQGRSLAACVRNCRSRRGARRGRGRAAGGAGSRARTASCASHTRSSSPRPAGRFVLRRTRRSLFFGLLRTSKGLDLLLRALPEIVERVPQARLVVAGDPLDAVEPLRALVAELGVSERVEWRLGYVPDSEIPELMEQAAVVVLPYRKIESSGVLATALGHGRPVVVTDVGSLGDTVREFGAGLVVEPEDTAALAAACVSLLRDSQALARAHAGAEAARKTLTWDAAAAAHEQLYEELRALRRTRTPAG